MLYSEVIFSMLEFSAVFLSGAAIYGTIEMLSRGWHLAYIKNVTRWCLDEDLDLKARFASYLSLEYECSIGEARQGITTSLVNMRRLYTGC